MSAVMAERPSSPKQLSFECKLKDGRATLRLLTMGGRDNDGVHHWRQLCAEVRYSDVRIVFAIGNLEHCHIGRWSNSDCLWVDHASFEIHAKGIERLITWVKVLGIVIEDSRQEVGGR